MAQLDESLHDTDTDDTSCVDKLVIDDNQVLDYSLPVADTGQDIEKAVAGVVGDLLHNVLAKVEEDGEELSSTPSCSQIPREDGKVTSGGLYKKLTCPAGLTDLEWKKYQQVVHFTISMTFLLNFFYLCN